MAMTDAAFKKAFGARLRFIRLSRGKTQAQMAEEAEISEEYFSKIERGLSSPSFSVIGKIADCLGIEPQELFRFSPLLDEGGMSQPGVVLVSGQNKGGLAAGWGVFVSTRGGRFHFVSPELAALLKYDSPKDLVESIRDITTQLYDDPAERGRVLSSLPEGGSMRSFDTAFTCKDGERLAAKLHICHLEPFGLPSDDVLFTGVIEGATADPAGLSERHDARRELHHRLKNQLGLLAGYIYLRAKKVQSPECSALLREVELKIHSLAHIHEHLHRAGGRGDMDAGVYLQNLAAELGEALADEAGPRFEVRAQHARMPWDKVSQLGMMLTELLTNAVKHASNGTRGGMVSVDLAITDGKCRLQVRDEGRGFPDDPQVPGYGLRLVRSLAEQLGGGMSYFNDNGAVVQVEFPLSLPRLDLP